MRHLAVCFVLVASSAYGGQAAVSGSGAAITTVNGVALPFTYAGPPPPELPATMARDAEGRTTVRAVRLTAPLQVDGLLDDAIYRSVQPISDFIQVEPSAGSPSTEKTDIWIGFDDENVYIGVHAWDTHPERMIATDMRRDNQQVWSSESLGMAFDTFYDHRNSVNFYFNAIGGRADGQVTNEGNWNADWNPIWNFAVHRDETGWTGEAAIPFKSIRHRPGRQQIWGVQFRRVNRWKNEMSYLTPLPKGLAMNGIFRLSQAATLVGIEAPAGGRPLDIKPYVTANLTTDTASRIHNKVGKDAGIDIKYGVTDGLAADFTANTDFAQVEADEQQVNLTRFSLFFPEKRDFFLENQGIFNFGGGSARAGGSEIPLLFYSRRIGLERGQEVPIQAGGRLSGRVGRFTVGLLNMETDNIDALGLPSTNFAVARVRRDILRRSAIGVIATHRSNLPGVSGAPDTFGLDGAFSFFANLTIDTFWARTATRGLQGDDTSYRGNVNYNGDRYGFQVERLAVGDNFSPAVGFVRRDDFSKDRLQLRFSPRPQTRFKRVRKFTYEVFGEYYEDGIGRKETRELQGAFGIDFQNSDTFDASHNDTFDINPAPLRLAPGVTIPVGGYHFTTTRASFGFGQQRPLAATVFAESGKFYGGTRTAFGFSGGRVKFSPRLSAEPGMSVNVVTLPYGDFTTKLLSSRVTYTPTAMMFISGLVQYNSSNNTLSTNIRLRWEYLPGSELFVVYNDGRDTTPRGAPDLQSRALVIKVNRLLRL